MGISGTYVNKFSEGNLATAVDISLDGGYQHVFYDIISSENGLVVLKSHWDGTEFSFQKQVQKNGQEYVIAELSGIWEQIYQTKSTFKILPMKGERF